MFFSLDLPCIRWVEGKVGYKFCGFLGFLSRYEFVVSIGGCFLGDSGCYVLIELWSCFC